MSDNTLKFFGDLRAVCHPLLFLRMLKDAHSPCWMLDYILYGHDVQAEHRMKSTSMSGDLCGLGSSLGDQKGSVLGLSSGCDEFS